jgi:hypothetical protein
MGGLALLAATRDLATGARLAGLVGDRPPPRLGLALESRLPEDSRPLDASRLPDDSRPPDDSRLPEPPLDAEADFDAESPPPESALALSDLAPSDFEASALDVESAFVEDDEDSNLGGASSPPARLRLFSLSPLKSVSYQPPPLRRKFGAETSFTSAFLPHDPHLVRGASEIFCITSV